MTVEAARRGPAGSPGTPAGPAAGQGASPAFGVLSHRQIMVILVGLMLGMFLAALDQTIVGTAIRTIADSLHGLDQQAWATTAYLITSTIATPLYGKLSDMYGRKPFFLAAIIIFILGSIACTFATSMYMLAAFRGFQGLGGGGLMALAFAIIGDIVPPRERAKYQGFFLAVFGTSSVLGPVLGGFFAGQHEILTIDGWRWVFLVNVPIAAIALVVVAKVLNVPHVGIRHRIDFPGAITLIIGLVPLLIIAEQGRQWGWTSDRAYLCYGIGALGILAFILAEKWAKDDALMPLRLFRNPVIALMSVAGLVIGMAMFGGIAIIPQYLQIVHGASPTRSGFLMLPLVGGMMVGTILSGQITSRTGRYKIFPIIGSAMMVGAMYLLHDIGAYTPLWKIDIFMAMLGFGLGNCMQTLTLAVQNAVSPKDMGVASASSQFFRSMGGTLGTAVFVSVLFSTVGNKIADAFKDKSIQAGIRQAAQDPKVLKNPANLEMIKHPAAAAKRVVSDSAFLQHIDGRLAKPFLVGFSNSMDLVFLLAGGVAAIAFVLFLFTKEVPLRAQSGVAARAAEQAGEQAGPAVPMEAPAQRGRHEAPDEVAAAEPMLGVPPPAVNGGTPIHGYVRQQGGEPVAEAVLTLIDPSGQQIGRSLTAIDGGYMIGVHEPGTYVLIARAQAHHPHATTVSVNGTPVNLDVMLAGSGGLVGAVRRTGGEPVVAATVTLADSDGEVVGSASTSEAGEYRFSDLVAGTYTLAVNAQTYQPLALLVTVPEAGRVRQDIELSGGAALRGTARTVDQRPIPDARVSLVAADGTVIATTSTDDSGRYAFAGIPEGDYTLEATGYPPVRSNLSLSVGERHDHEIRLSHDA